MKVNWTPRAIQTFEKILTWLQENWTQREVDALIDQTEKIIKQIQQNPYLYKESSKNKQVRRGLVNQIVSLFYRVHPHKKEIDLLVFWDYRQNPEKNQYD